MSQTAKFSLGVGALIRHSTTGKILLLRRSKTHSDNLPDHWEPPYGRLQHHEGILDGLRREIFEETGMKDCRVLRHVSISRFYRGEHTDDNEMLGVGILVEVDTEDVRLSVEHTEYMWSSLEEARQLIKNPGLLQDIEAAFREDGTLIRDQSHGNTIIG